MYERTYVAVRPHGGNPGIVSRWKFARGKALKVAKPAFPPRAPPFRARFLERTLWWMSRYWEGDGFYDIQGVRLSRWGGRTGKRPAQRACSLVLGTTYNIQQSRIHRPANKATHSTTQNSGVAGRGGARGGEYGLRNYECFPSSHLPHAKMLHPGRENTCYMQNAPSRKGKHLPHAKMLPPWKGIHFQLISC